GLWLRHMLDGEFHSRGLQRVFVDFADFLRNWRTSIKRIERGLGITLSRRRTDTREVENLIDVDLCHHSAGTDDQEMCLAPGPVRSCYEAFCKLVRNPNDADALRQLDQIRTGFEEAASIFGHGIQEYYDELLALRSVNGQNDYL